MLPVGEPERILQSVIEGKNFNLPCEKVEQECLELERRKRHLEPAHSMKEECA